MATLVSRITDLAGAIRDKFNLLSGQISGRKLFWLQCDFPLQNNTSVAPFLGTAFGGGSVSTLADPALMLKHPGVILIRSSATANSGYRILTSNNAIVLQGNEESNTIFNSSFVSSTGNMVFGFTDAVGGVAAATNGAFIQVVATSIGGPAVVTGKNYSSGLTSNTATTGSLTAGEWYHARIKVNSDATLVTFSIYKNDGTFVWSDTLSTNIPKTAARSVAGGTLAWDSSGGNNDIVALDYLDVLMPALQRGAI